MNEFVKFLNENIFLFLLIVGVVLSWLVRPLFDNPLPGGVAAVIVCLICLIVYFLRVKQDDREWHNPDNCYYMGLLFTLAALIYSLVTLFLLGSDAQDMPARTYNLIGSFGIALISTFAGILFRILLLQGFGSIMGGGQGPAGNLSGSDKQPQQLTARAHAELAEAAFRLRQELTQTIADMNVFRKAIEQAVDETHREGSKARAAMVQQAQEAANEQTRVLSEFSAEVLARLAGTTDEIAASVSNIKKPLEALASSQAEQARRMHEASTQIADIGESLAASMSGFLEPLQDLARNLPSANESIQSVFTDLTEAAARHRRDLRQTITDMRIIAHHLRLTNQGIEAVSASYDGLNASLERSANFLTGIEHDMAQAAKNLTVTTDEITRTLVTAKELTPRSVRWSRALKAALRRLIRKNE